jgi:hypothetical protein
MAKNPEDEKSKFDRIVDRREALQSIGKFSAIAALALAGPSFLLEGCGSDDSVSSNVVGEPLPDGSSPEQAIPLQFGDSAEATVRASDGTVKYYRFDPSQYYDVSLVDITAVSFIGGTVARCTLLNSNLQEIDYEEFDGTDQMEFSVDAGTWYIKFEALHGGGVVSFSLVIGDSGTWDNYNDWENYSDGWSNYSDGWSNYSDGWSNYSDSWGNYSDSWYNYSDYGAWGNWIESW